MSQTNATTRSVLKSILIALVIFGIGVGAFLAWNELRVPTDKRLNDADNDRWEAFQRLTTAKNLAANSKHKEALAIFEQLVRSEGGSVYGWNAEHQAALSMGCLGHHDAALERIRKLIADCPYPDQVAGGRMTAAELEGMANRIDESRRIIDQLIADYPKAAELCANALFTMSRVYRRSSAHAPQWAALQRIADDYPAVENTARKVALAAVDELVADVRAQQEPITRSMASRGVKNPPLLADTTTVWNVDEGPYLITEPFVVGAGSTLRIEAGTLITFSIEGELRIEGALEVAGTPGQPVRLVPLEDDPRRYWWSGIVVPRSSTTPTLRLAHCHIVGAATSVRAESGTIELDHCVFDSSGRAGLLASGNATVRMVQCEVNGSHRVGVEGGAKTELHVEDCKIRGAKSHGIFLMEVSDRSVIRRTTIEACAATGVLVRGRTQTTIDQCIIRSNGQEGVYSVDSAAPSILASVITANGAAGIRTEKRWDGVIARTRITDNARGGIQSEARSAGKIVDNLIEGNGQDGIRLRLASSPTIERNRIAHNEGAGLLLQQGSLPSILRTNQFVENGASALQNEVNSELDATDNWWGTTTRAKIESIIQDRQDNEQWGLVTFAPFLTQAPAFELSRLANE